MKKEKKYIKTFEQYDSDYDDEDEYEDILDLPTRSIDGIFYHGTTISEDDELFLHFNPSIYSDHDAVWVSSDEDISKDFADNWRHETSLTVVFKMNIQMDNFVELNKNAYENINEYYGFEDLREAIPILSERFNGWITTGSIGRKIYDDICIFDYENLETQSVSMLLNGKWTEYMTLEQANEILQK